MKWNGGDCVGRYVLRCSFIFKENFFFIEEKDNPVLIVEEELDGIDTDDIGNLEDLRRLAFIDNKCLNLNEVFADGGEVTRNADKKK